MKFFLWIFSVCSLLFAEAPATKTLRISTWPSDAEVYIGERPESFVQKSNRTTPQEIPVSDSDSLIRATFFKPGFADTTIDIQLSAPGKNFVWIELSEESDLDKMEWQKSILQEREKKWTGKILFFSGILPFALSGTFAGLAEWNFHKADEAKESLEHSVIQNGDHFQKWENDFHDKKESGKNFRTAAIVSLGIGALLWTFAAIFTF